MAGLFSISVASNSVRLDNRRQGAANFTVFNASGRSITGQASTVTVPQGQSHSTWLKIEGDIERSFPIAGTSVFDVTIQAPVGVPAGTYTFRLNMVEVQNPDETFAEGPTVSIEVPASKPSIRFPWWILLVAGVVLVVIVGLVIILTQPRNVVIPELVGKPVGTAIARLSEAGLMATPLRQGNPAAEGIVFDSNPSAGTRVPPKSGVDLFISLGQTPTSTATLPPTPTSTNVPDSYSITATPMNWVFSTSSNYNQYAMFKFNYSASGSGKVRFIARPYEGGRVAAGWVRGESPVGVPGTGTGQVSFSISSGPVTIDEVRVQMWDVGETRLLAETSVATNYHFTDHPITNITLSPSSPANMTINNQVTITFNYSTTNPEGVRIYLLPFTSGGPSPNYGVCGSPIYPAGNGTGDCFFTIRSGQADVDQIQFKVVTPDQSVTLDEWYIPVTYRYR